ncbi:LCP family protein [Georgenia soli]|uniref:LCP family protein n=1 Tax=Georgenia soli TaxID=638953 RepID=UPI001FE7BD80|nr:LCP family protein [Georgenia soli]
MLAVLLLAWPIGLLIWADTKIQHTEALTGAPNTPGTTYLLAGSDSRADGTVADATEGQRSDTIMVLQVPSSGPAALVSLPRDTLVDIPGHGMDKLNASYSIGGPTLLTETVEQLTGLTVDHYVEIGMGGVQNVVDAVGGVELCLDYDVDDQFSGLRWTAGCHTADGPTALAFARMRYSDPNGDLGRAERQRQVIGAVMKEIATPGTVLNPVDHVQLVEAGTGALVTDTDTGIVDLARLALAFRSATGPDGVMGAPPVADYDYRPGGIGSTVLLDEQRAPQFFQKLRDGELTPSDVETAPR